MSFSASCSTTQGSDPAPPPAPFAVEGTTEGIAPRSAAGLLAPYEPLSAGAAGLRRPVVSRRAARPGGERAGFCSGCRRDLSGLFAGGRQGRREGFAHRAQERPEPGGGRSDRDPLRLEGRDAAAFLLAQVMGGAHDPGVGNPGRERRLGAEARRQARADRLERAGGGGVPSHRRRRAGADRADPGGGDRADPDRRVS